MEREDWRNDQAGTAYRDEEFCVVASVSLRNWVSETPMSKRNCSLCRRVVATWSRGSHVVVPAMRHYGDLRSEFFKMCAVENAWIDGIDVTSAFAHA